MEPYTVIAKGLAFPEGPIVLSDGSLLVVEISSGKLTKILSNGLVEVVCELGGGPNGAAIGPDGKVYICNNGGFEWVPAYDSLVPGGPAANYTGGSIQTVDLQTGHCETIYTHCGDVLLKAPNDIVFDRSGGFWFTDYGQRRLRSEDIGSVFYARADGSEITEQIFPISHANGIALSPDETALYVAETIEGRVRKYDIKSPGVAIVPEGLFNPESVIYGAPGFDLFDSMAVEENGNLCVATLPRGGITVISPDGALIEFVKLPDSGVTNIAFGGDDMRTAYITLSLTGEVISMPWSRSGHPTAFQV